MTSLESSPVVTALWETVDARWDEFTVHEAFLHACAEENDLAFAARKYREQKESSNGARHARAEAQLSQITVMALAQMAARKTVPKENKKTLTIVAALVSGALLLACVYLLSL